MEMGSSVDTGTPLGTLDQRLLLFFGLEETKNVVMILGPPRSMGKTSTSLFLVSYLYSTNSGIWTFHLSRQEFRFKK